MHLEIKRDVSNQLKGIAILFVVLGHLCLLGIITMPSTIFEYAGVWGVTIFLMMSGYGLMSSYLNKGIKLSFLYKRLNKVWVPYVVITLVWVILDKFIFHINHNNYQLIKYLFSLDFKYSVDPTMWYITYIGMWYIIFFIIFIIPINNLLKVILIISFSIALKISDFNIIYDWNFYTFAFPFGVIVAFVFSKVKRLNLQSFVVKFSLLVATIICLRVSLYYLFKVYNLTFINELSISSILLTLGILCFLTLIKHQSKVLIFLGSISYEIYLIEGKILFIYNLPDLSNVLWIKILDFLILLILSAFILHKVVGLMNQSLQRRVYKS
ncbi:peptidoglycan/LPS O-acetylase OafA/YrhL [Paenibacillus sp. 4624]|uniref:acyltransferase family protein n=1 Tax=Paenibacillus sp. 4624 TaxID=3156453 RepID=UPI003D26199B